MKSFTFLMLALILSSQSALAARIGQFKVRSCSLLIPRETPELLFAALMNKGYHPMNSVNVNDYIVKTTANGDFESKTAPQLQNERDYQGAAYLDVSYFSTPGFKNAKLALGILGTEEKRKYRVNNVVATDTEGDINAIAALPACTDN